MSLESDIIAYLRDGSPNTAAEDRVYWRVANQNAGLPRIVISRVSTAPQNALARWAEIDRVGVQIDCWAPTKEDAAALAAEVKALLAYDLPFKPMRTAESDDFESESRIFRHILEFTCWDKSA